MLPPALNLAESNFEPPLSPPLSGGLRTAPLVRQPEPEPEPEPEHEYAPPPTTPELPLPTRLLQSGLVTLPQLSAAMQQASETGHPLQDVLVASGAVAPEAIAALVAPSAVASDTVSQASVASAPEPAYIAAVAAPTETPSDTVSQASAAAARVRFAVVAELENGSKIEVGVHADADAARDTAAQAMRAVAHATDDWPLLGGRYVRPTAVVAIEVAALL